MNGLSTGYTDTLQRTASTHKLGANGHMLNKCGVNLVIHECKYTEIETTALLRYMWYSCSALLTQGRYSPCFQVFICFRSFLLS